jgi:YD repeat-containing protein
VFDRNRLLTATSGSTTVNYNYDPFGRTDTVTAAGAVIERYTYDGFDHIAFEAKNTGTGTVTTTYAYDPFDRTVSQTDNAGASNAKTTLFDYLVGQPHLDDRGW